MRLAPSPHRTTCRRHLVPLVLLIPLAFAVPSLAQDASAEAPPETTPTDSAAEAPPVESAAPGEPNWFDTMLARQIDPLPLAEIGSEDGFFRANLPAKLLKPIEALDGVYLLSLDFGPGADSLAECYVYHDALDLGASLMLLSDAIFGNVEQAYGPLEAKAIYSLDAGGIGAAPYMGLAWLYRARGVEGTGGAVAGQAKHWLAVKQGRALYCQTTAVGYDDALFGLFRSLVATVEYAEPLVDDPYYVELALVRIGGEVVGIDHTTHRIDQDGDVEVRETSAMLLPVDTQTLQASDSVLIDYSDLAGDLVAKLEIEAEGGELVTQLNLARNDADEWIVNGTFQGKELEANLGEASLRGHFGERLDLRRFVETAEVDAAITFPTWTADIDPTRLIDMAMTYRGVGDNGTLWQVAAESVTFDAVFDEAMGIRSIGMAIGATDVSIEQIYAEGDAFAPLKRRPAPAESPVESAPSTPESTAENQDAGR